MSLSEKIKELLIDLPVAAYYLVKPRGVSNCIVYTYSETPALIGDMDELGTQYLFLFNLYSSRETEATKELVKTALNKHGFKKRNILNSIAEGTDIYNTPMQYTITIKGV